jgi:hypothetical protein
MTMDELTLVAQLRDNYPAGIDLTEPQRRLAAEISAATAMIPEDFSRIAHQSLRDHEVQRRGRRRTRAASSGRRFGPKLVAVGAVAAGVAAATVIALHNVPAHPAPRTGASLRASADTSGVQLASYAAKAAAGESAWQPDQWVYSKILRPEALPKPGATNPAITWTQVDGNQFAYYQDGKLVISNEGPLAQATPVFWKNVTASDMYSYLLSLPTTPATLRAVIVHNLETAAAGRKQGPSLGTGNYAVFEAIAATLTYYVLPPKLLAAVYGVLAADPVVHFDKSVTDNADQTGVGFYTVQGIWKSEIMINPSTYAYMGHETVAVASQIQRTKLSPGVTPAPYLHVQDGYIITVIKKGEAYWTDLASSGIVQKPGETP